MKPNVGTIKAAVLTVAIALAPAAAFAEDQTLTTSQLKSLLTGKSVSFSGGGYAEYVSNGTYKWRGQVSGKYFFKSNKVCVDFGGGNQRCDRYVKNGKKYYLINNRGRRFRARIRG